MNQYFKEKVAIVTGGAAGLGLALSEELGRRGARVVVVDINQEGAEQVASSIRQAGGEAHFAYMDVSLFENTESIIKNVVAKYGRLDFLFNNAGTAILGETRDLSVEHWRKIMDVNLWGVIYCAIAAYRIMEKQGQGQIVNISSLAGLIPVPKEIPYCTSKWAIVGFSDSLRIEGLDLGIKVNLVCPGIMQTSIHKTVDSVNVNKVKLPLPVAEKYFIAPQKAAVIILNGVQKNKPMIIFPFYARLVWLLNRFFPSVLQFVLRKVIRDFRKFRITK